MEHKFQFDYYYGVEAEQFSFYRIPRALIKDNRFKGVSSDAKLLYGLMLDRMAMSMHNGWLDEKNRVYIIYTLEDIMEDLNCSKGTGVKILAELDTVKGIGLIERKKRGQGKPTIIFVKNFIACEEENETGNYDSEFAHETATENDLESEFPAAEDDIFGGEGISDGSPEVQNLEVLKSENRNSGENEPQEVQNLDFKKSDSWTSRGSDCGSQEVQKPDTNYNNRNYSNLNYSDLNYSNINQINQSKREVQEQKPDSDTMDTMEKINAYMQLIRENIEYDHYMQYADWGEKEIIEELYQVICDVVCVKRSSIRIGKEDYPYELVKSKFLKINNNHIQYVMECMKKVTTKVTNIRSYLITALYNAPITINSYYQQEVQHDMYGGGWSENFV